MDEDFGASFISLEDDDGHQIELELLDGLEFRDREYMLFLPADMDENDPDYGYVILRVAEENGEEQFEDVDDPEELQAVYEEFMKRLFEEDGEE